MSGVVVVYQYDTGTVAWSPLQELTGSHTTGGFYGSSVAMVHDSGTSVLTIAVGEPGATTTAGSVFIHRYESSAWTTQQLTSDAVGIFGSSIALSGNMLVVGEASYLSNNGT